MVDSLELELRELDKRVTHLEAGIEAIKKDSTDVKLAIKELTQSSQKLELKLAWAAGAVAVAMLIGQIAIQGIFAFVN